MRAQTLLAATLCLLAGTACADPVGYYGNTLLIDQDAGQGKMIYRPNHSFTLVTSPGSPFHGDTVQGTWEVKKDRLCLTPAAGPMKPFCVADDPTHKLGDRWVVLGLSGKPETLTLVAGTRVAGQ